MKALHGALALAVMAGLGSLSYGQVAGKVTLEGEAPEMEGIDMSAVAECAAQHADPVLDESVVAGEGGELANVVISISTEAHPDVTGDAPADPAVLDQQGCTYHPHVMSITTGQKLVVKNSDPFLHNVHSFAEANPAFNFGQPNVDEGKEVESPKVPEYIHVKCDVHPWMSAYIGVFPHPFHAVSGEDGTFSIANVPDGDYTFVAWHEKYGTQEQTATVTDGKAELNFTFDAASAQAEPAPAVIEVQLASDKAQASDCPIAKEDGCCDEQKQVVETDKAGQPQAAAN